jgi:eukaryotic-like serine/threonine-protein kinase
VSYLKQTCKGLQAAHEAGVVHRDIKPANLMITPDGKVKIMDFGIARMGTMAGLTQSGMFMGTPRYISPEMARGAGADIRSDLYALGLLTYEMLTGTPPFDADNPWAVLRLQLEENPTPLRNVRPEVPAWLEAIVNRAIAKDPARRFQDPGEMLAAVEQQTAAPRGMTAVAPRSAAPTLPPMPVARRRSSRGLVLGLGAAAAFVALGLVAVLLLSMRGSGATATPPPVTATSGPVQVAGASDTPQPTESPVVIVVTSTPEPTSPPTDTPPPTKRPRPNPARPRRRRRPPTPRPDGPAAHPGAPSVAHAPAADVHAGTHQPTGAGRQRAHRLQRRGHAAHRRRGHRARPGVAHFRRAPARLPAGRERGHRRRPGQSLGPLSLASMPTRAPSSATRQSTRMTFTPPGRRTARALPTTRPTTAPGWG